ncbi:unnamed protein product [Nippostrongylus brasiliensis]|uniref:PB1 domain-containing protein n=1 Tax=Nippostrongylus brasiliensis TaxID=27835 RepID=A0A0N4XXW3_NIPBR|nr:hypothetical protein Q1695_008796 [Nippostrongylus brasiliensis]VDL71461.1 unnamed protein product [Nippostrongylus brasiliensis]
MPDDSTSQTVTFKLHLEHPPRINVTYKDKRDLFEQFKKNAEKFGFPLRNIFWIDDDGEPTRVNNADALLLAANSYGSHRLYVREEVDETTSGDDSTAEEFYWGHRHGFGPRSRNRSRSRGGRRSRSRTRSRSRDNSRARHRHHLPPPPPFGPFDFRMMDSRFGGFGFPIRDGFGYPRRGGFSLGRGGFGRGRGGFHGF